MLPAHTGQHNFTNDHNDNVDCNYIIYSGLESLEY